MHSLHPWTWMPASACRWRRLRLPLRVVGRERTGERCGLLAVGRGWHRTSVGDRSLPDALVLGRMSPAGWYKHPWCCCGSSGAAQRSSGGCSRLQFDFADGADGAEGAKAGALGRRATCRDDEDVHPIRLRPPLPLHSPPGGKRRAILILTILKSTLVMVIT